MWLKTLCCQIQIDCADGARSKSQECNRAVLSKVLLIFFMTRYNFNGIRMKTFVPFLLLNQISLNYYGSGQASYYCYLTFTLFFSFIFSLDGTPHDAV